MSKKGDIVPLDEVGSAALGGSSLLESLKNDGFVEALTRENVRITPTEPATSYAGNTSDELLRDRLAEELFGEKFAHAVDSGSALTKLKANKAFPQLLKAAIQDVTSDDPLSLSQWLITAVANKPVLAKMAFNNLLGG